MTFAVKLGSSLCLIIPEFTKDVGGEIDFVHLI